MQRVNISIQAIHHSTEAKPETSHSTQLDLFFLAIESAQHFILRATLVNQSKAPTPTTLDCPYLSLQPNLCLSAYIVLFLHICVRNSYSWIVSLAFGVALSLDIRSR